MAEEEQAEAKSVRSLFGSDHSGSSRQKRHHDDSHEHFPYQPLPGSVDHFSDQRHFLSYHDDDKNEIWRPRFFHPDGAPILNGDVSRNPAIGRAIMQALDTPADVHRQFQYSFQDLEGMGNAASILYKEAPHGTLCQLQPAIKERDKFKYLYEKAFKERDEEKKEKEKTLRELEALQFDLHASPQVQSEVDKLTAKV